MTTYSCNGYMRITENNATSYKCLMCEDFFAASYSGIHSHILRHHPEILQKKKENNKQEEVNHVVQYEPSVSKVKMISAIALQNCPHCLFPFLLIPETQQRCPHCRQICIVDEDGLLRRSVHNDNNDRSY